MSLPYKLNTDTIVEVVTEFKFTKRISIEDLFLDVFSILKANGYEYTKLPIMELPQAIREGDKNLAYVAYYRFIKDKNVISIGPKVLSFGVKGLYAGWESYKPFILENMKDFKSIIDSWGLERTSMRYINFFEGEDILDRLKIVMSLPKHLCGEENTEGAKVFVNEIICKDKTNIKIHISNQADLALEGSSVSQRGSLIDIDSYLIDTEMNTEVNIENLHTKTKTMFFGLLEEKFLMSLGPNYKGEN